MNTVGRTKRRTAALVTIVALVIAALATLDWFLENTQHLELQSEAHGFYLEGSRLLTDGKPDRAVDLLRKAHALARNNRDYQLGLVHALMTAGKIAEAEPLLDDILQRDPNNGRANLSAARLMITKGNIADAESYYHRAIYGAWSGNAAQNRVSARMELVQLLAKSGRKKDLLAELLPLEQEAGSDPVVRKRLAHLFLIAGSATRAVETYQTLIQQDPKDAEAYSGLGEAELERGRYRAAQSAFLAAFRDKPGDSTIRRQIELSSTMSALDPTPRQLTSMEKYRRGLHLLDLTRRDLERCIAQQPAAGSPEQAQRLLAEAEQAVSGKAPARATNELAEEKLALTQAIWQVRIKACGPATSTDERPLSLIVEKLTQ